MNKFIIPREIRCIECNKKVGKCNHFLLCNGQKLNFRKIYPELYKALKELIESDDISSGRPTC